MEVLLAAMSVLIGSAAMAQPEPVPTSPPALRTNRADLAFAYMEFERTLAAREHGTEETRRINLAFDRAMMAFFRGGFGEAARQVRELTASLSTPPAPPAPDVPPAPPAPTIPTGTSSAAGESVLSSLLVRMDPPVWVPREGGTPRATLAIKAAANDNGAGNPPNRLTIWAVRNGSNEPAFEQSVDFPAGDADEASVTIDLPLKRPEPAAGLYVVRVRGDGGAIWAANWVIAPQPMRSIRESNSALLDGALARNPGMTTWVRLARTRNDLLTDTPSDGDSAQFLADLPALASQLQDEIADLTAARNPYQGRVGDWWGEVMVGEAGVPFRCYAPAPADPAAPRPLVIVLHGAGGDESMFMDGYGNGRIKTLADQHGFVVVSPRSSPFLAGGETLDAIVGMFSTLYMVDRSRVYVIGHSLGAGVAAAWARLRPDTLAAACCIAGFATFKPGERIAPVLAVAAELDGLSPIAQARRRTEAMARALAAAGDPKVEFREIAGYGHTLVVGRVLPEALDWLLTHRQGR